MRTKKKSSGKIPEKKSAVPYKSAAPHRHKPSRPLQTVKLPNRRCHPDKQRSIRLCYVQNIIKSVRD